MGHLLVLKGVKLRLWELVVLQGWAVDRQL